MPDLMYRRDQYALREYIYLPLFYMIPHEPLAMHKLDKFPRNPFVAIATPKWRRLYRSYGWLGEIVEIWLYMIWPHLGIRGRPSHYTINDSFIRQLYSAPMWAMLLSKAGLNCNTLASIAISRGGSLPYISDDEAEHNCKNIAKLFWSHPFLKAKETFEIIREHRDQSDFSKRRTAVYIDFLRKYYHTRAKLKSVPLQSADGEHELIIEDIPDIDNVVGNDWIEKFYGWLDNEKDIEICKLLYIGRTQKEIAHRLGYANHSGVNKRIAKIRDILYAFVQWQIALEEAPPPSASQPSNIRYDTIEFSYKRK